MLSSSLDTLLKVSKTKYPKKLFAYDCVTLYIMNLSKIAHKILQISSISVYYFIYGGYRTPACTVSYLSYTYLSGKCLNLARAARSYVKI